jgi:hypothetical protein
MVGLSGFEPLTSRLSGVRSNQLSYRPGQGTIEVHLKTKPSSETVDLGVGSPQGDPDLR